MRVTLLAVGKLKKGELSDLAEAYLKRFRRAVRMEELEVKPQPTVPLQKEREGEALLKRIPEGAYLIALDERGETHTSREIAARIEQAKQTTSDICCLIGGADGLSEAVKQKADLVLSFGRATWSHQLVRIMILEQLYRAQQIAAGHPYHRD